MLAYEMTFQFVISFQSEKWKNGILSRLHHSGLDCPSTLQGPCGSDGGYPLHPANAQPDIYVQQHEKSEVNSRHAIYAVSLNRCSVIKNLKCFMAAI